LFNKKETDLKENIEDNIKRPLRIFLLSFATIILSVILAFQSIGSVVRGDNTNLSLFIIAVSVFLLINAIALSKGNHIARILMMVSMIIFFAITSLDDPEAYKTIIFAVLMMPLASKKANAYFAQFRKEKVAVTSD